MAISIETAFSTTTKPTFLDNNKYSYYGKQLLAPATAKIEPVEEASTAISMFRNLLPYSLHNFKFKPMLQSMVYREASSRYNIDMITYAYTDIVIVGAGYGGLSCAYELSKNPNVRIVIIEPNKCPAHSFWLGDCHFHAAIVWKSAYKLPDKLGIEYDKKGDYVVIKHVALFTSTIISKLLARPNVKLFNAMAVADLIVKEGRVCGVVPSMNHDMQSPRSEPKDIEAKLVVNSYVLDGLVGATAVNKLRSIGIIGTVLQMNTLDMNAAQDAIVRLTREIVPGMIVIGMEAAEIEEASGVKTTLGTFIITGQNAAHITFKSLGFPHEADALTRFTLRWFQSLFNLSWLLMPDQFLSESI